MKIQVSKENKFTAAALQMCSTDSLEENLQTVETMLANAKHEKIDLLVLPENFALMPKSENQRLEIAESDGEGKIQQFLAEQAAINDLWVIGGTIPILCEQSEKVFSSCLVYDNQGRRQARYDKVHLFDVTLSNGKRYAESDSFISGSIEENIQAVETPWGKIGLSVCYDVRFPELYRALSKQGVVAIAVPAAFTKETGKAHWELLLRARAVENISYVIGSGQYGKHANGRFTWGHSMIVNPWGAILAIEKQQPSLVVADIDLDYLQKVREEFPCLSHRRI